MKKVLFTMMAALLVCGMSFAQQKTRGTAIKLDNPQTASAEKSGWVGNTSSAVSYFSGVVENGEVAILPKNIDASISGQITKVKYYHFLPSDGDEFTNNSYVLKIYDNVSLEGQWAEYGEYDLAGFGEASYTQEVTFASTGWQEITLTTPYTIPSTNFAVAMQSTDKNPFIMGAVDAESAGQYLFHYYDTEDSTVYWSTPNMQDGLHTIAIAVFVEDGTVYEEQYDIKPEFLNSSLSGTVSTIEIGEEDGVSFVPYASNEGPDAVPAGTNVTTNIVLKVNGEEHSILEEEGQDSEGLPVGYGYIYAPSSDGYAITITHEELAEMIGSASNFIIEFTCNVDGDSDPSNNTAQLLVTVTRFNPVQNLVATPEGSNVVLTWDAPEAKALSGYIIFRDGTQIASRPAGNPTYTDANVPDGLYEYCVEAVYNQTVHSEQVCVETTVDGINEMAENIAVYPNPANSFVKIANAEGAKISVINSLGQVVANINEATAEQEINVAGLANGIYTIRISNNDNVVTRQFSVSK